MTTAALSDARYLAAWTVLSCLSLGVLLLDVWKRNPQLGTLMKWVWGLTVLYSGPLGLGIYWFSGRRQIARDSIWRRACRSVAHCYSGCGAGEVAGVILAAGVFTMGTWGVAASTFALAYLFGFGLTAGPLMEEGVALGRALWDAFSSETASITVMEVTAIGVDLWLAGSATIGEALFWSGLAVSLSAGLVAAYPVNVVLIWMGVKEGMHSPKDAHGG